MSVCPYCEEEGGVFLARCGHNFHKFCINMLGADDYEMKCPSCRTRLSLDAAQEEQLRRFNEGKVNLNRLNNYKLKLICKTVFEEKRKNFADILLQIFKVSDLKMFCLYEAALAGHFEAVEWILCRTDKWNGFKLLKNSEESGNKTLLKYVLDLEFPDNVFLVEEPSLCANILNFFGYGAGPITPFNKQEYLNRLFLITCSVGNVKMVQKVLEMGAKIDSKNENGKNAISYATRNIFYPEVIDFLVSNGVKLSEFLDEVDYSDSHCYKTVEKLINYGEKVNLYAILEYMQYVENNSCYTEENVKCLHLLVKNNVISIEELLLEVVRRGNQLRVVKELIDLGADIHAVNKYGQNVLHVFCYSLRPFEQAEYFLSLDLDVNAVDHKGESALYRILNDLIFSYANRWAEYPRNMAKRFQMRATRIVELLLEKGADVNLANNDGISPIHLLYEYSEVELLKILVKHGADINSKNKKGRTLAHNICEFNGDPREEFIKTALELGLDTEVLDIEGKTPLDCCLSPEANKQEIKRLFSRK